MAKAETRQLRSQMSLAANCCEGEKGTCCAQAPPENRAPLWRRSSSPGSICGGPSDCSPCGARDLIAFRLFTDTPQRLFDTVPLAKTAIFTTSVHTCLVRFGSRQAPRQDKSQLAARCWPSVELVSPTRLSGLFWTHFRAFFAHFGHTMRPE